MNFVSYKSAKYAIITHLQVLNFVFYEFKYLLKAKIYQINNIQSTKNGKTVSFRTYKFAKVDFTEKLGDTEILKFPHSNVTTTHNHSILLGMKKSLQFLMPYHGCIWNWSIWPASTQGDLTTESRRRREECKCCTCLCRFPFIFWWMLLMFWRNIHLHSKVIFLYFLSHKTLSYLKLLLDFGQHSIEEEIFCVFLIISILACFQMKHWPVR